MRSCRNLLTKSVGGIFSYLMNSKVRHFVCGIYYFFIEGCISRLAKLYNSFLCLYLYDECRPLICSFFLDDELKILIFLFWEKILLDIIFDFYLPTWTQKLLTSASCDFSKKADNCNKRRNFLADRIFCRTICFKNVSDWASDLLWAEWRPVGST